MKLAAAPFEQYLADAIEPATAWLAGCFGRGDYGTIFGTANRTVRFANPDDGWLVPNGYAGFDQPLLGGPEAATSRWSHRAVVWGEDTSEGWAEDASGVAHVNGLIHSNDGGAHWSRVRLPRIPQ